MDKQPLFTIAVVTFQQRHLLNDCLSSIFKQTYTDIELVVCDDESCDFDVDEVKQYIDKNKGDNIKNVIIHKQAHNVGPSANFQTALELSNGELIRFQAGDDMLSDENILMMTANCFANPNVNVISSRAQVCTHEGELMTGVYYPAEYGFYHAQSMSPKQLFEALGTQLWGKYICSSTAFFRRSLLIKINGFDLNYKYVEDWPLWLKICERDEPIMYWDQVTTTYRLGGTFDQLSSFNEIIRKEYYLECIKLLERYVRPRLQKKSLFSVIRCQHICKCLNAHIVLEDKWKYWGFWEKTFWKIKEIPFLLVSNLYAIRNKKTTIVMKTPFIIMLLTMICFYWNISLYPGYASVKIWSFLFCLSALYVIVLFIIKFLLFSVRSILNLRHYLR